MQTEAFGPSSLVILAKDAGQMEQVIGCFEGNLTGCLYTDNAGSDDDLYDRLAPLLRAKVGRLLNDKMPTGVAVTAAMNHGGPFPATGPPRFHLRRHPGQHPPFRRAIQLRQCSPAPSAARSARQEPQPEKCGGLSITSGRRRISASDISEWWNLKALDPR